uniref:Putative LOV domain-containing protein n=1 Tax=Odontosoria sp. BC-2016 TaxID=1799605 RepID=A0A126WW38_9MONI|nr:putative LOV domain-containing protein [Odontosoria sp. BC-2016]
MGREATCSPAAATATLPEKPVTDNQEASVVKYSTESNVLLSLGGAAAAPGTIDSIKTPSYTVSGSSMGDLVVASFRAAYNDNLREALQRAEFNFVLTDPRIEDNPIVYASDGFLRMTGYTAEEVLGRNCRFLQGPSTNRHTITEIRDAIREERGCQVCIINYTKQGKPFWNLFHMAPVYSKEDGRVVHFVGVQTSIISNSDQSPLCSAAVRCFCAPATAHASESSSTNPHNHIVHADPLKHDTPGDVDEDNCEVKEADKMKAKLSVDSLMSELVSKCKGMGVAGTRSTVAAKGRGGERVICSSLMLSLTKVQQSFVLANPQIPDCPIVHASEMFLRLTGYSREEVIGRNCRFLQGPDTDCRAVQLISESLRAEKLCTVRILNYRKDKTPFWNLLHIAPIRSSSGKVAFFAGMQLEVQSVEEPCLGGEARPDIKQLGAVGAVRVAVRSLQGDGLRRILKC